jgi:hypothetical protein
LLKPLNEDIQESPITQQRAQVQQTEDANQKAMLAGFLGGKPNAVGEPMSPSAEAGQSATEMERQKITAPIEAARVKGQADIAAEQERSKGLIGAAHEREVGYSGRTSYQMQKDIADNANKMQVALVNANRAVDAAAIGRIITENAKVQEGIDRGALQADDPAVMGHLATLEAQLRQFQSPSAGPNTTVPTTTEGHAQRLLQQMPGKSIDEYLNHVEANEGGFDRPQDKEGLRQALIRAGAH